MISETGIVAVHPSTHNGRFPLYKYQTKINCVRKDSFWGGKNNIKKTMKKVQ